MAVAQCVLQRNRPGSCSLLSHRLLSASWSLTYQRRQAACHAQAFVFPSHTLGPRRARAPLTSAWTLDAEDKEEEGKVSPGLRRKAALGWDGSLAVSCCVTLGVGLSLSEPQFPAFRVGMGAFRLGGRPPIWRLNCAGLSGFWGHSCDPRRMWVCC